MTKKQQHSISPDLQKIFITGVATLYSVSFVAIFLSPLMIEDGWRDYMWSQLLMLLLPLVIVSVVYLTRTNRTWSRQTIFEVLVATFGIVLLVFGIGTMMNLVSMWLMPKLPTTYLYNQSIVTAIYYGLQVVAFGAALTYFVLAIRSSRRRGDW
jgi:hypothetical protein